VRSPAEKDLEAGFDPTAGAAALEAWDAEKTWRWDIDAVFWCERVVLLPGGRVSQGALVEANLAQMIGRTVSEYVPGGSGWYVLDPVRDVPRPIQVGVDPATDPPPTTLGVEGSSDGVDWKTITARLTLAKANPAYEVRTTSTTGAEKGVKPERFDLFPSRALEKVARVFGFGTRKYADRNWEKGYKWGLSFGAMMRHLWAFWRGEARDPESGELHTAHAAWHALVLTEYQLHDKYVDFDDRSENR
jgi:hypothetical protein